MWQTRQRGGQVPRRGYKHQSGSSGWCNCSLPVLIVAALFVVALVSTITMLPHTLPPGAAGTAGNVGVAGAVTVPPPKSKPTQRPATPATPATTPRPKPTVKPQPPRAKNPQIDYHFVHIPKCGGFCDHNAKRRCATIKGCINHIPQRKWIFKPPKSITLMREPFARLVSAFFYRGHSPNLDFFQVRPEFKQIKLGKAPKVEFPEYVEMVEYQNIQTRMLGADSFPYRAVEISDEVFTKAKEALQNFYFVGIQEQYDLSVELLQRQLGVLVVQQVENVRENSNPRTKALKDRIRRDSELVARTRQVNDWDVQLYALGVRRFCKDLATYPDLLAKLDTKKVDCAAATA